MNVREARIYQNIDYLYNSNLLPPKNSNNQIDM